MVLRRFDQPFLFFVCTLIFEKKELKIINCLNRMCTLTDISIIAEWIFLK